MTPGRSKQGAGADIFSLYPVLILGAGGEAPVFRLLTLTKLRRFLRGRLCSGYESASLPYKNNVPWEFCMSVTLWKFYSYNIPRVLSYLLSKSLQTKSWNINLDFSNYFLFFARLNFTVSTVTVMSTCDWSLFTDDSCLVTCSEWLNLHDVYESYLRCIFFYPSATILPQGCMYQ